MSNQADFCVMDGTYTGSCRYFTDQVSVDAEDEGRATEKCYFEAMH
jgi:hypothetical protein